MKTSGINIQPPGGESEPGIKRGPEPSAEIGKLGSSEVTDLTKVPSGTAGKVASAAKLPESEENIQISLEGENVSVLSSLDQMKMGQVARSKLEKSVHIKDKTAADGAENELSESEQIKLNGFCENLESLLDSVLNQPFSEAETGHSLLEEVSHEIDGLAEMFSHSNTAQLLKEIQATQADIQREEVLLNNPLDEEQKTKIMKDIEKLKEIRLNQVEKLGKSVFISCNELGGSAATLIATIGSQFSNSRGWAGGEAVGVATGFITLVSIFYTYNQIQKAINEKQQALEILTSASPSETTPLKIKRLKEDIQLLKDKLNKTTQLIVLETAGTVKSITTSGDTYIHALLDSGSRLGQSALRAAPLLHVAATVGGSVTAAAGTVIGAYKLSQIEENFIDISYEMSRLESLREEFKAYPVIGRMIELKLKNLNQQRESTLADFGLTYSGLAASLVGMTAVGVTAAGMIATAGTLGIIAGGAAVTGLVGYGGYKVYKKRHQLYVRTEQFSSLDRQAGIALSTASVKVERAITMSHAKGQRARIASEKMQTAEEVTNYFNPEIERISESITEMKKELSPLILKELVGELNDKDLIEKKASLEKEIDDQSKLRQWTIAIKTETLLRVERTQKQQVETVMKKPDELDEAVAQLASVRLRERETYDSLKQKHKDATLALNLGVAPEAIPKLRKEIGDYLKSPEQSQELFRLISNRENIPDNPSADDFLDWLTSSGIEE